MPRAQSDIIEYFVLCDQKFIDIHFTITEDKENQRTFTFEGSTSDFFSRNQEVEFLPCCFSIFCLLGLLRVRLGTKLVPGSFLLDQPHFSPNISTSELHKANHECLCLTVDLSGLEKPKWCCWHSCTCIHSLLSRVHFEIQLC